MKDTLRQSSRKQPEISHLSLKITIPRVTRFPKTSDIGERLARDSSRQRINENTIEVYLTGAGTGAYYHQVRKLIQRPFSSSGAKIKTKHMNVQLRGRQIITCQNANTSIGRRLKVEKPIPGSECGIHAPYRYREVCTAKGHSSAKTHPRITTAIEL